MQRIRTIGLQNRSISPLSKSPTAGFLTGEKMAFYETGKTSALSGQKPDLGEESHKRYIGFHPVPDKHSLSKAFFYLGLILLKRREFNMAGDNFEKSLEYDAGLTDAVYYLRKMRRK